VGRKTLRQWREMQAITQQELANRLGVHVQYVSAIECGRRRPGMTVALRIRDMTGGDVSLDDLVAPRRSAA